MNPEFQRNLWLEIGLRRLILMAGALTLVFLAANVVDGADGVSRVAEMMFYVIAVVWGARAAGASVVGEIRDRTWDAQRLSSLTPFAMTWGKLLGSTSYAWVGGAICLLVRIPVTWTLEGPDEAIADLCYFVAIALMAQAVAMFASLVAVRRRQAHSRMDVFLFQIIGISAGSAVWWVWQIMKPNVPMLDGLERIYWWGMGLDSSSFYLASLAIFLIWAFVGCYRLMRRELQVENGPFFWTGFLAFMVLYAAGFDAWRSGEVPVSDIVTLRLLVGAGTVAALTYAAILFEPKDKVLFRWLKETLAQRRYAALVMRLQGWMIAYALTVVLAIASIISIALFSPYGSDLLVVTASGLGFLTRDIGIFLLFAMMPGRHRGDGSALVTLLLLYGVLPQILGSAVDLGMFYPVPSALAPLFAWVEAAAVWAIMARSRISALISQPVRK